MTLVVKSMKNEAKPSKLRTEQNYFGEKELMMKIMKARELEIPQKPQFIHSLFRNVRVYSLLLSNR